MLGFWLLVGGASRCCSVGLKVATGGDGGGSFILAGPELQYRHVQYSTIPKFLSGKESKDFMIPNHFFFFFFTFF